MWQAQVALTSVLTCPSLYRTCANLLLLVLRHSPPTSQLLLMELVTVNSDAYNQERYAWLVAPLTFINEALGGI